MINKLFAPFTASNIVQNTWSTFHCSFLFLHASQSGRFWMLLWREFTDNLQGCDAVENAVSLSLLQTISDSSSHLPDTRCHVSPQARRVPRVLGQPLLGSVLRGLQWGPLSSVRGQHCRLHRLTKRRGVSEYLQVSANKKKIFDNLLSRSNADCNFFSFIGTQCFHLSSCETTEPCAGCMSGPPLPPISECQESTTEAPMTTTISTSCDDFTEGICPLTDENIIITTTAQEAEDCQTVCRSEIYKSDDKVRIGWIHLVRQDLGLTSDHLVKV